MNILKKAVSAIRGEQFLDKLIKRGLTIGQNHTLMSGSIIDPSHCWHIKIGNDFWLGHYSQIIAHDASTKKKLGYTKVSNVIIGNSVFIGANCIVLPGVTIGDDVVIGSGSVVTKAIPSNSVAVGNPAKVICSLDDYISKEKLRMQDENVFDASYTVRNNINEDQKQVMINACEKYGKLYVE